MTVNNAIIYPENSTHGITLNYADFIRTSYICNNPLTLEEFLNWNEILKLRSN